MSSWKNTIKDLFPEAGEPRQLDPNWPYWLLFVAGLIGVGLIL